MITTDKIERPQVCGVVEGFYGRPWTFNQRKELFERMQSLEMNTYLYAPKDDLKHRQMWRELYNPEESSQLGLLINSANENHIMFVYAISPGLDITFSNNKDVECLKSKMKQVMDLGCHAFALLFDDIDPNLNAIDKTKFDSLASAQVSLTNELYKYLLKPKFFLFCPTEYCATRAVPSVFNSEYLNTIGEKLLPNIDIMWTGPKVISKSIPLESIEELSHVLRRSPVIWDNIHANDYDQKRLFLGPYCGRSNKLLEKLRGVLTNPNCEFEANYIAIFTLAQWFKLGTQINTTSEKVYDPLSSLEAALESWIKHLYKVTGPAQESDIMMQNRKSVAKALMATAVGSLPPSTASIAVAATQVLSHEVCTAAVVAVSQQDSSAAVGAVSESIMEAQNMPSVSNTADAFNTIENALVDDDKDVTATAFAVASVVTQAAEKEAAEISESETLQQEVLHQMHTFQDHEKMDNAEIRGPHFLQSNFHRNESIDNGEGSKMQTDISLHESMEGSYHLDNDASTNQSNSEVLTFENLRLLVDLYYLPYEHGSEAIKMLELVHWLRSHAHLVDRNDFDEKDSDINHIETNQSDSSDQIQYKLTHWRLKATQFHQGMEKVRELTNRFCHIPNKSVLGDLYSYLQDIRHVLETLDSYIQWLERAKITYASVCAMRRLLSWCTPGYKEMFTGDDYESWMFRGGLITEFQRMFPVDNAYDLFPIRASFIQYSPDFTVSGILSESSDGEKSSSIVAQNGCHSIKFPRTIYSKPSMFNVRPFRDEDRLSVYSLCFTLVNNRASLSANDYKCYSSDIFNLPGDRYVGVFLDYFPEYCLVLENDDSMIVGYAVACMKVVEFEKCRNQDYFPKMRNRYSKYLSNYSTTDIEMTDSNCPDMGRSAIQNMINQFQRERSTMPQSDNSVVFYFDMKECYKPNDLDTVDSLTRRLLICLFSALKTAAAENSDQNPTANYPTALIGTGSTLTTSSIAIVSQGSLITTSSVPLVAIGQGSLLQVTSKDRAPVPSLTVYAEVDFINKSHKDVYKRYGFTEILTTDSGSDDIILTRII